MRLAEQVFAPHYAAPLLHRLTRAAPLRAERDPASEVLASLDAGTTFEVLEVSGALAWGRAPALHLVGYVDADALAEVQQ